MGGGGGSGAGSKCRATKWGWRPLLCQGTSLPLPRCPSDLFSFAFVFLFLSLVFFFLFLLFWWIRFQTNDCCDLLVLFLLFLLSPLAFHGGCYQPLADPRFTLKSDADEQVRLMPPCSFIRAHASVRLVYFSPFGVFLPGWRWLIRSFGYVGRLSSWSILLLLQRSSLLLSQLPCACVRHLTRRIAFPWHFHSLPYNPFSFQLLSCCAHVLGSASFDDPLQGCCEDPGHRLAGS